MMIEPDCLLARYDALPAAAVLAPALADSPETVYLVGGAVRDLVRGIIPAELDLMVDGDAAALAARIAGPASATVRTFPRFGTATVIRDGYLYDLAVARSEVYARPGALPTTAPADAETDLRRRDFTVNAIALGVAGADRGRRLAVPGALEDLKAGILRVLHPASFRDDPTRLLRLARYAGRLGFAVAPDTRELAAAALTGGALDTVSGPRIGAELRLLAAEPDPVAGLQVLAELGIDHALAPGFGLAEGNTEATRRSLDLLPADASRAAVALAAATMAMDPTRRDALLARLGLPAAERDPIAAAASGAPRLTGPLGSARTPSQIANAVGRARLETVALAGGLGTGCGNRGEAEAPAAAAARKWLEDLRHVGLKITGTDLLAAGVPAGGAVGAGLAAARAAVLDGRARDREAQLAEALRAALA